MFDLYLSELPDYLKEMAAGAAAHLAHFLILFQMVTRRLKRKEIVTHGLIGLVYTYIGLTLFPHGRQRGLYARGQLFWAAVSPAMSYNWILVPIGYGHWLLHRAGGAGRPRAEQAGGGDHRRRHPRRSAMNMALSIGVALSLGLAMIRVLTGISIMWFLIPGYAISLALSFVVPHIFTAVAFDSGGVASGPMTATFLLPFAMGACDAAGRQSW